jgi:hypothetical protein
VAEVVAAILQEDGIEILLAAEAIRAAKAADTSVRLTVKTPAENAYSPGRTRRPGRNEC